MGSSAAAILSHHLCTLSRHSTLVKHQKEKIRITFAQLMVSQVSNVRGAGGRWGIYRPLYVPRRGEPRFFAPLDTSPSCGVEGLPGRRRRCRGALTALSTAAQSWVGGAKAQRSISGATSLLAGDSWGSADPPEPLRPGYLMPSFGLRSSETGILWKGAPNCAMVCSPKTTPAQGGHLYEA